MNDARQHWEQVYQSRNPEAHSWFQPQPQTSLELIHAAGCGPEARVIDVGGGTSQLVDALLAEGYAELSVLDISPAALNIAKQRLGEKAAEVVWIEGDITAIELPGPFELWHDRAVFHFLTEAADRAAYVRTLRQNLAPNGHVVIASFAEDGPTRCSGLPVVRYSPPALLGELGEGFELVHTRRELHQTPAGKEQSFVYCLFRISSPLGSLIS